MSSVFNQRRRAAKGSWTGVEDGKNFLRGDLLEEKPERVAAAGYILAELVEGRRMVLEPIVASVDPERCSACRVCGGVCPYKAIGVNSETARSEISPVLCQGCGTCVAACPAGAISGSHFTNEQIIAEMEALLV